MPGRIPSESEALLHELRQMKRKIAALETRLGISTAVGYGASAAFDHASALGNSAVAGHTHATAIGADAVTTAPNQVMLGTAADVAYGPGGFYSPVGIGMTVVQYVGTDSGTTTRITYDNTLTGSASGMTLTFVAPPSGRVWVTIASWIKCSAAGTGFVDCVITDTVTTTVKHAASDTTCLQNGNTGGVQAATSFVLAGLVPGNSHSAVLNFRSSVATNTVSFDNFRLIVAPSIGT